MYTISLLGVSKTAKIYKKKYAHLHHCLENYTTLTHYEPTNCCVRKITQLVYNFTQLCTILHKLCNISYTIVGKFVCFTGLCKIFKQWSNSVFLVTLFENSCLK